MHDTGPLNRYQLAELGSLLAEPARAAMLLALADGTSRPAGELAHAAGVTPATASAHLHRLLEGGLLALHVQGRADQQGPAARTLLPDRERRRK